MAIFTAGGAVGQISGRVAGMVFSHNKSGPYVRNGTFPTQPVSGYKNVVKERLTVVSEGWNAITEPQRIAWRAYAAATPMTNRLGKSVHMSGNAMFVAINTRVVTTGPLSNMYSYLLENPPGTGAKPLRFTASSMSYDIGAGDVSYTYDLTPLGAGVRLFVEAAVTRNKGVTFVKNLFKLCAVSALAAASPQNLQAAIETRFGALVVGQRLWIRAFLNDRLTGHSGPVETYNGLIVST